MGDPPRSDAGLGEDPLFLGGGEMAGLMGARDWSDTAVGPPSRWPASLRTAVGIMLRSRFPMFMGWGPQLTMFYNDAYVPVLGAKHPEALGSRTQDVWSEIWDVLGPLADEVQAGGANFAEDLLLVIRRAGFVEETYFTFSYSPLLPDRDDEPAVGGLFCACVETTERVVGERRLRLLSELGEVSAVTAATAWQACEAAVAVLSRARADVPLAVVYLLEDEGQTARRVAHYGVSDGTLAPATMDLPTDAHRSMWSVVSTGEARVVSGLAARYAGKFTELDGPMGHADPDSVMLWPLGPAGGGTPMAVLVTGVSPFRPLDEGYRRFLELVAGQVIKAIADAQAVGAQRRRAEELAELDRAKTEFFTGVSHELRTPLTLIAGPAQDALDDVGVPLVGRQRQRLELIRRNSGRLRRLIDTLLEVSRIEGGRLHPELVATELSEFTRGIVESFAPAVDRAGLELVIDCPALPTPMLVDHSMWEKIVLNLLSNAVKYTLEGTITVRLLAAEDGGARLEVSDTGLGIPPDELGRVFERFHRVRHDPDTGTDGGPGRGRSIEGTGIGLALVAELAALHGGTATAASTVGSGSTFTVFLPSAARTEPPVAPPAQYRALGLFLDEALQWAPSTDESPGDVPDTDRALPADADSTDAAGLPGPLAGEAGSAGGCVLVVEDNRDLRTFIAGLLQPFYGVLVAGDGRSALDLARREPVDLVLADVMMPGLDGFELLAALRSDPTTAGLAVILLSARAGQEAVNDGLAAGADDYLVKPFSSTDLLARVRSNMELARLRNHEAERRAAMVNSLQDGFYVQDLDAGGAIIEINPAMTDLLGLRPHDLPVAYPFPFWPTPEEDPQGHAELQRHYAAATEAGRGHGHIVLALRHVSTRAQVWVSLSYSSFTDLDRSRRLIVGTMRDVTDDHRAELRAAVLAETGRLVAQPGDQLIAGLQRLVDAAVGVLGQRAYVTLRGPDGLHRVVVAAHRTDRGMAEELLALPPHRIPGQLAQYYHDGRGYIIERLDQEWLSAFAVGDTDPFPTGWDSHQMAGLTVPLVVAGRPLGSLGFIIADTPAAFTSADLGFAEELGRRVAVLINTDQAATREQHLHQASTALAAAASVAQAAQALATTVTDALNAHGVAVFIAHPEDPTHLRLEHAHGLGPHFAQQFLTIPLSGHFLSCQAVRTGQPIWLGQQHTYQRAHPHLAKLDHIREAAAVAVLPLRLGGRTLGALALTFTTPREFPPAERQFAMTLVGQAAQAIERAILADTHTRIASVLQTSLLPATLPEVPCLAVATHYQPAGWHSQAGGDWYDIITLPHDRVSIVVGDVVGNGAAAAAIMGQLRAALASHLLDDQPPAAAITKLNQFARTVPAALGSTVTCLQLNTATGNLRWASAGHPPPLVVTPGGADYLHGGNGIVLGAKPTATYREGQTTLAAGSSVLLYTDGLVERRRESIDDGLDRLLAATRTGYHLSPARLLDTALAGCLPPSGTTDDVALIVARLLPAPLQLHLPGHPDQLRPLRRQIRAWATQNGLSEDAVDDLILAASEAVENCIEHAYRRSPADGEPEPGSDADPTDIHLRLQHRSDGSIHAQITDHGRWKAPPTDPGYRGRGLHVIDTVSDTLDIDRGRTGTTIAFTLARPP